MPKNPIELDSRRIQESELVFFYSLATTRETPHPFTRNNPSLKTVMSFIIISVGKSASTEKINCSVSVYINDLKQKHAR